MCLGNRCTIIWNLRAGRLPPANERPIPMLKHLVIAAMMISSTSSPAEDANNTQAKPPTAKKIHKETKIHGDVLQDDYFWLREKGNPEVAQYLEAENAYTDAVMTPTKPLRDKLYKELLSHVKETDESVPYPEGGWLYYSRVVEGKQYPIHARKHGADAPEQITVDVNELAQGEKFMALGAYQISDDGNHAAYNVDVYKSRGKKYLFVSLGSHTTSETRYLDANTPDGDWTTIAPRVHEQEYYVDHHGDQFY